MPGKALLCSLCGERRYIARQILVCMTCDQVPETTEDEGTTGYVGDRGPELDRP